MTNRWPTITAFIFGGFGFLFMGWVAIQNGLSLWRVELTGQLATAYGGFIGGVVGPIFSLAAFLLVFQTIRDQRRSAEMQQFEGRLFQLLQYYENTVMSIRTKRSSSRKGEVLRGRDAFYEFVKHNIWLFNQIKTLIPGKDDNQLLNISYIIFFYGLSKNAIQTTKGVLGEYLDSGDVETLVAVLSQKPALYDHKIVYFGGHQLQLGHYFRQLFQIVTYIDDARFITANDKYRYAKLLRSLLSNYEQGTLLFNAMSTLGNDWITKGFIDKYRLIKNIPLGFLSPVDPKKLFPGLTFEFEERRGTSSTT